MALVESGRWEFTLNLIEHLPRTSATAQAMSEDEEAAELAALSPQQTAQRAMPLTEWTPEMEALAAVFDRLGELVNAVVVNHPSGKGRPQRVQPYPRPVTEFDRARRRREQALVDKAMSKAFPNQFRREERSR